MLQISTLRPLWLRISRHLPLAAALAGAAIRPAAAQTGYAVLGGDAFTYRLATFQVASPGTFTTRVVITGLGNGQDLAGIDARPNTGQLYALGYAPSSQQAQLYTLNATTGALTAVGGAQTLALGSNSARIGFDFNPTADRIRVTAGNRAILIAKRKANSCLRLCNERNASRA